VDQNKINTWFEKGDWLQGWPVQPDSSINKNAFSHACSHHKDRWEQVFAFLNTHDPLKLESKRYDLDGDNLFLFVSEYTTKNPEDIDFEVHRKYIDLQYVPEGTELIGIAPLSSMKSVVQPYDETKDIEFITVKEEIMLQTAPDRFFIFFPEDAHKPGVKAGTNEVVRKIVFKISVK